MDDRSNGSDEGRLILLYELDAAKALTRKLQAELGNAVSALARSGRSPDCLRNFETVNRAMNEAVVRYRLAIDSLNAFSRKRAKAVADTARASYK